MSEKPELRDVVTPLIQAPELTSQEFAEIINYTGTGYRLINEALRENSPLSEELLARHHALCAAIRKHRLREDALLYRGLNVDAVPWLRANRVGPGTIIPTWGFMSCSRTSQIARRFADYPEPMKGLVIEFIALRGTVALDIAELVTTYEGEVLFPPETSLKVSGYNAAERMLTAELIV